MLATLTLLQLENTKNASAAMEGSKSTLEAEISKYISGNYGSPSASTATPNAKMPEMPPLPKILNIQYSMHQKESLLGALFVIESDYI